MSLSTTANRVVYNGNGSATAFGFTFPIPDASYLSVIYTDTTGAQSTIPPSQYSVTGIGTTTGGSVTYPLTGAPIATGTKLTLVRTLPYTQGTIFSNQGGYFPEVVESTFDKLTMMVQQLADRVGRALAGPVSDTSAPSDLPTAAQRANTILGFDASGNPIATVLTTSIVAVSTFIQNNLLPAASASAARTALGIGDVQVTPQGRLTLATGVPVVTSNQASKNTIFYTPYIGNLVPIWNGTAFISTTFTELSNLTTQSSTGKAGPAVVANNSNYDLFVWSDSGTLRLTRGPLWTSDTARGTGAGTTELTRVSGLMVNAQTITNGPAAGLGTYVGTVRSDGSALINTTFGAIASGGTAAIIGVWNAHNRALHSCFVGDTTDSWSYSSGTWRPANNSTAMRVSYVQGLQIDSAIAEYGVLYQSAGGFAGYCAVGFDSTTAISGRPGVGSGTGGNGQSFLARHSANALGFHFMQALERSNGVDGAFFGDGSFPLSIQNGLTLDGWF